ncbi:MAG: fumarate reductase subunit C [Nitrospirae bacterium]|nr:MAG: fumarate reductase subunit C [Nitrospirota bacterium]
MTPEIDTPRPAEPPKLAWRMPSNWWTRKRSYRLFMVRELSAVFVAVFLLGYVGRLAALARGEAAYYNYMAHVGGFFGVLWNLVALACVCYHAWTWFHLSGVVAPPRLFGRKVEPALVVRANLALWAVVSLVLFLILT